MGYEAVQRSTQLQPPPKPPPAKPKDPAKTEQQKRNTRDWILQYAQEDSDSDDGYKKVLFTQQMAESWTHAQIKDDQQGQSG